jgi:hypothetical protein
MSIAKTPPVVCALSGTRFAAQVASNHAVAREGLIGYERDELHVTLIYRAAQARQVHALVEAERECCQVLRFEIFERDDTIRVEITIPPHAAPTADEVIDAFVPPEARPPAPD